MTDRWPAFLVACAVGTSAGPASGTPAVEARYFDDVARERYARRDYRAALDAFLLAFEAVPNPRLLYNAAIAASLSGEHALAFAHFEAYLASGDPDATRRTDAEARTRTLAGRLALVRIESDPPGATIFVDRRELGDFGTTPRTLALDPGEHTIELVLAGHHDATAKTVTTTGQRSLVAKTLAARVGRLTVTVKPEAATVELFRGATPMMQSAGRIDAEVPVGSYRARVTAARHAPAEATVSVREGSTSDLTISAEPLPAPTGTILLSAGAVSARVWIDGAAVAMTPARIDGVTVGRRTVEVRAEGFAPWRGFVEVARDRARYVEVALKPMRSR